MATEALIEPIRDANRIIGYRVTVRVNGQDKHFFCKHLADAETVVEEWVKKQQEAQTNG